MRKCSAKMNNSMYNYAKDAMTAKLFRRPAHACHISSAQTSIPCIYIMIAKKSTAAAAVDDPIRRSKSLNRKALGAYDGKFLLSPRLVPSKTAV